MQKILIALLTVFTFTQCASILSKSSYPITITSSPSAASVSVTDIDGNEIFTGETPASIVLSSSARFFKRNRYTLRFSKPGFDESIAVLECKVDGWYWGNLLLGGIIGMLIVDPATGAMYKFRNQTISTTLPQSSAKLDVIDINNLGEKEKENLVRIN